MRIHLFHVGLAEMLFVLSIIAVGYRLADKWLQALVQ
jgi:hypothetical protein